MQIGDHTGRKVGLEGVPGREGVASVSSQQRRGFQRLGRKATQLQPEIMVRIGGTCSASSFSSCLLFHLTAKIKAYNQTPLIGPEDGCRPTGSSLSAENDNEAPVNQDSGPQPWPPPADSQLLVIVASYPPAPY